MAGRNTNPSPRLAIAGILAAAGVRRLVCAHNDTDYAIGVHGILEDETIDVDRPRLPTENVRDAVQGRTSGKGSKRKH